MSSIPSTVEKLKVSDLIAELLESLGIEHLFGIIGAGNVHLFEAIAKRGFTEIVCVHHEQAACMAMQTYFRINGKLCGALLTTGAGSTNGVTGVYLPSDTRKGYTAKIETCTVHNYLKGSLAK
jgi:acetolactate synthase-1/2/3 large subunit